RAATRRRRQNHPVIGSDANWTTSVTGTTPEYFDIRNWPMSQGGAFLQSDVDTGTKVVVLGQTVVTKLFGENANPVGHAVRIGNIPFNVIGVAARKGQSASGPDSDDAACIPVTTFAQKIQGGLSKYIHGTIFLEATSADSTSRALKDITNF